MKCSACGGPYHPATGHMHTENVVLCGPCTRDMLAWVKKHTSRKGGRTGGFYEAAATSIKVGKKHRG